MDTVTWVVIFLLVITASLASYLLSQWNYIRNSAMGIAWVAISAGTILLLVTAAMVVLTAGLLPPPWQWLSNDPAERMSKSPQSGRRVAEQALDRQQASTDATTGAAASTGSRVSPVAVEANTAENSGHRNEAEPASVPRSLQSSRQGASSAAPYVGLAFAEADPWAATNCVHAINPDPEELARWTVENECGAPVSVLFAACSRSLSECDAATSWEYQGDAWVLPGKAQRPVTLAEQTRHGKQIRYVACVIADRAAIDLIGQNAATRSSPSWLGQFDMARNTDECMALVQRWSGVGRASGKSIDVLLGADAPGEVRPVLDSER